jgi:hypothetical protein
LEKIDNETEKSAEELKLIDHFNNYLAQEFKRLGLEDYRPLDPAKVHLLAAADFPKDLPGVGASGAVGMYQGYTHAVFIDKEAFPNRLELFKTIIHEMAHAASFRLYEPSSNPKLVYQNYKLGYRSNKFNGLNEAVTDLFTYQFFLNEKDKLSAELGITSEEWQKTSAVSYNDYCNLVDNIMTLIAQKNEEEKRQVWARFKKGYFSGTMMHLRDVEKALEPGSLRLLAKLGYGDNQDAELLEYLNKLILAQQKTAQ